MDDEQMTIDPMDNIRKKRQDQEHSISLVTKHQCWFLMSDIVFCCGGILNKYLICVTYYYFCGVGDGEPIPYIYTQTACSTKNSFELHTLLPA